MGLVIGLVFATDGRIHLGCRWVGTDIALYTYRKKPRRRQISHSRLEDSFSLLVWRRKPAIDALASLLDPQESDGLGPSRCYRLQVANAARIALVPDDLLQTLRLKLAHSHLPIQWNADPQQPRDSLAPSSLADSERLRGD